FAATSASFQRVGAGVDCLVAKIFIDPKKLVIFRDPVGSRHRPGFDLASIGGNRKVGDERVFTFAGAVGNDNSVGRLASHVDRVEGLRQSADLVDLDQDRISNAHAHTSREALSVGNEQIVANELGLCAKLPCELLPTGPIVFSETVFNGNDGIFLHPFG